MTEYLVRLDREGGLYVAVFQELRATSDPSVRALEVPAARGTARTAPAAILAAVIAARLPDAELEASS